ncbi:MAG: multicopper oxidase domain-containing protein [Nitrospirota bacterium]|nr:multicopper oxidase domain-containing protein [Nitrospirota bacterium]
MKQDSKAENTGNLNLCPATRKIDLMRGEFEMKPRRSNKWNLAKTMILGLAMAATGLAGATDSWAVTAPVSLGTGMQCPNDIDNMPYDWSLDPAAPGYSATPGAEDIDWNGDGAYNHKSGLPIDPTAVCRRVGTTDGYVKMPDGSNLFIFGFMDLTGVPEADLIDYKFKATLPAPDIEVDEGQSLYLTITNLGLLVRPDLADPHTVHFHGYAHAVSAFDGVPEMSVAVPPSSNFTYFYKLNDPGTYGYHCHVEPTEHIALGMVGTIIVNPAQNNPAAGQFFAYNDGGAAPNTRYDVAQVIHMHDLDADKHHNLETVAEGRNVWAEFKANYYTFNGRAYPETLLPAAPDPAANVMLNGASAYKEDYIAQPYSSLITANVGQRILLRLNNLTYRSHSLVIPGIPMHVVGKDAKILRGPDGPGGVPGTDLSYHRSALALAGGEEMDVILDTTGLAPGTYFLYGRELDTQANLSLADRQAGLGVDNRGGMITEIRLN